MNVISLLGKEGAHNTFINFLSDLENFLLDLFIRMQNGSSHKQDHLQRY